MALSPYEHRVLTDPRQQVTLIIIGRVALARQGDNGHGSVCLSVRPSVGKEHQESLPV